MKKNIKIFIFLFTLLSSFLSAQQSKIDSLFSELKKWQNKTGYNADTTLYNIYYNLGVQFQKFKSDTVIYFLKQSIARAQNIKDAIKEAESINQIGRYYYVKGDYNLAMQQYELALKVLPEKVNEKEKIRKQKVYATILGNIGLLYSDQDNYTDALEYYFKALRICEEIGDKQGQAANLGSIGIMYTKQSNYANALEYYFKALRINEEIGDKQGQAANIGNIGIVYTKQSNYAKALEYYFKALKINEEIGNKQGQATNLGNIGIVYHEQGNYAKALEYYFNALKINEEIGDKQGQSANLGNIGGLYYEEGNYTKALEYYFKALRIKEEIGNKEGQATNLGNIGMVYSAQGNYVKAIEYYFKALRINEEIGNKQGQASNLGNIGIVYEEQGNYAKALEYYFNALKINEEIGDKGSQAINLGNIGDLYIKQKKYKEAEEYLKKAIAIGEELHIIYYLESFYNSLSELYSKTARHQEALEAYKKHVMYRDSINSQENKKALATKEMQYQFEKKQAEEKARYEKMMALAEAEKKRQKIIIWFVTVCLILILAFLGVTFYSLQVTKKQKRIIEEAKDEITRQKEEVEKQKKLVEEKNKEITDSILYARRIQDAILPDEELWKKLLPDSFVLYLPKDIVAGDFYWLVETDDYIFVASADCTGHGVPGAMVSVTCSHALNITVLEEKITNTNEILNRTREIVIKQLQSQQQEQLQDGMDICLVRINKSNRLQIQYSGANRPLVVINNGELKEYTPDKQPIGYHEGATPFNAQDIEIEKGSYLYLFTDGYADQFGGEKNKKLGAKRWKKILLELAQKSTEEQFEYLKDFFQKWKGDSFQTDDVTVIGIRC
jgi:tetratricopeptide (TPR) repeat protein